MITKIDILLWGIIGIVLVMFIFWKMHERREKLLHQQEKERQEQRAHEKEYDRVEKLAQAGTREFRLIKFWSMERDEPAPADLCIEECAYLYGQNGKFELRLTCYWDKFKPAWLLKGEIWFIYPEKNVNQKIHEGNYYLPMEFPPEESTQIFTYTNDPDEEGSNLFYFRNDCSIDHKNGLYIRINHPVTQEGE